MYYKVSGLDSLIIYFGDTICDDTFYKVNSHYSFLKKENMDGIIELIPSYTTLFIEFDIFKFNHEELFLKIKQITQNNELKKNSESLRIIEIPVYYGSEVGVDLQRVAKLNNLLISEVIQLHLSKVYRVYTIGFAPAFGYMGTVDEKIATPRLATPRKKIPKNSVALADNQTAVYPLETPGGWNIIGKTYLNMFDKSYDNFSYLRVGDKVQFKAIDKKEFLANGGEL